MRTNLYTALYHSLLAPSVWSDVDGRYRGPDDAVHAAKDFTFRSTFSLWDTFRAQHPLLTLVQPGGTNTDIVKSLVASRKHSPHGILPVWQFHEIGRASCRERVCQVRVDLGGSRTIKKQKQKNKK